jgi:hypothetical protein
MTAPNDDHPVGYKRPPIATRWKKGRSGNPKGARKRKSLGALEMIDRKFAQRIDIFENGEKRRVTVFEAILLRIWAKELAGSPRAAAVRMQYQALIPKSTEPQEIIVRELDDEEPPLEFSKTLKAREIP